MISKPPFDSKELYLQILEQTLQYIQQEYPTETIIVSESECYPFFRDAIPPPPKNATISAIPKQNPPYAKKIETPPSPPVKPASPPPPSPAPAVITKKKEEKPLQENLSKSLSTPKSTFQLEKLSAPTELPTKEYISLMQLHCPHIQIQSHTPLPLSNNKNVPPVVILSYDRSEKSLEFQNNVAQAIQKNFMPCKVFSAIKIEQENKWDALLQSNDLRLIIAPCHRFYETPLLLKKYLPTEKKLGKVPFLSCEDPASYFDSPALKSQLWRAISEILKNQK